MTVKEANTFDAIVIGSGISGGWAAKELCDNGLKTVVLERGRDIRHIIDYPTAMKDPWEFAHRGHPTTADLDANPVISKCYAYAEDTEHFFVKDKEHPYEQKNRLTGSGATRLAANRSPGAGHASGSATSSLPLLQSTAMRSTGPYVMTISRHSIPMSNAFRVSAAKTGWKRCPTVTTCLNTDIGYRLQKIRRVG